MKKFIYPIAAIFALISVSAFTPEDCAAKSKGKEVRKSGNNKTRHLHDQRSVHEISSLSTPNREAIAVVGNGALQLDVTSIEMSAPRFQESDEQIDILFNREETTIELTYELLSDELVNTRFMAENEVMLAAK